MLRNANAFNEIESEQAPYIAYVWQGEPHWSHLQNSWKNLMALQNLPCAIYQSPSYFEYLGATENREPDLLAVSVQAGEPVIGLTPVQELSLKIPFSIGRYSLFSVQLPCLRVLGSEPMVPNTRQAYDRVFELIARQYLHLAVVEMESVSVDGFLWEYLFLSPLIRDNYFVHVLHGVRDCHFVHLPTSIEEYRRRLGRKIRHNLERQERVLERHLQAPLVLKLLNREEDVPAILSAMEALEAEALRIPGISQQLLAATRHGFHYSFVLKAGQRILGMASGTKSNGTYKLHLLCYDKELERYSPGTTLWHQMLRTLIRETGFDGVDLGYGAPVYPCRRMNTVYKRGKVLLFRRTVANRCLIAALNAFSATVAFAKNAIDFRKHGSTSGGLPEAGNATRIK